ncbi:MAG TPA: CocE/NonD family hydrolase [Oligoflexus sp.]|uniref:CocE/NonD family hydrolase n=1 Tax=Oligoflexus sp. TaxID=1971216 RepID=UPI002D80F195|nr:CocE/NonD family hydrolase [Oligoflexus sp.]HET9241109.1 CocE/NonD family hydrolase [Oligoflexus sp.]
MFLSVRPVLVLALLLFGALSRPVSLSADEARPDPALERAQSIRSQYSKFEYRIPMRDGVRLFTSVYVPVNAGPAKTYPILMVRTPYSVAPYGLDRYKSRLGPSQDYEKEGFIFVFQDVRGKHMSEGTFVNVRPHRAQKRSKADIDESTDTYDTIAWLLKNQAFNNGKVGQWGISYPGFYTSAGAIDSHPALKAVSPQAPIADWWRGDDMHRNGAFNLQLAFSFFNDFGRERSELYDEEEPFKFDYGTPDAYQFFLELGALPQVNAKYFKNARPFWNEVAAHPNYDAFWQERNLLPHLKGIKAAVMTVGGWYDTEDLYGPLQTYKAIESQNPGIRNSLVMGPWTHGGWQRTSGERVGDTEFGFKTSETYQKMELAFFNHHLKGGPDPRLPEVMVFETGANRWRNFESWPPRSSQKQKYFLREGQRLDTGSEGKATVQFDEYVSDPARPVPYTTEVTNRWSSSYMGADQRFAAQRPDVLVYQTEVLKNDLTVAGSLDVDLWFSTTGSDADVVIKLIDVWPGKVRGWEADPAKPERRNPGGQQLLVRGEPMRARFRDGWDKPKPMVPGEVTRVRFSVNDVLHTFQRGHRIMIQVQSSWFPFIDRNPQTFVPNIFEAKDSDFIRAMHRIHRDAEHPSSVTLPVLDPS